MGFLVLFARKMSLKSQVNDLNYKLMQKQQELQDLQSYSAAIADGEVSMNDLTSAPASMYGRMSQYMVGSHNYASQAAQMNYSMIGGQQAAQQGVTDPQQYQMYQQSIFCNMYQQQKQQYLKAEQARLHVKEKAMEKEQLSIEQQLKLLEAELSTIDRGIENGIKDAAPQYA